MKLLSVQLKSRPDTEPSLSASRRRLRDSGHLLLAILLMMALMIIAATYEAPRMVQQMKRDREEEMIHRGTEYARGIKKFYKKFGRYPTSLEQLDNTNNIRFIRKRYKDPLSKDGKWTLLHYGDIAMLLNASTPGVSAASLASGGQGANGTPAGQQSNSGFGSSSFGSSNTNTPTTSGGFGTSSFGSSNAQATGQGGLFNQQQSQSGFGQSNSSFGSAGQSSSSGFGSSTTASSNSASGSTLGNNSNSATGLGSDQSNAGAAGSTAISATNSGLGQVQSLGGQFGGGAIVGVASLNKDPTIRIYNKKKTYNEWQFIYNPQMDQQNVLLRGPYSPSTLMSNTNIGTPAGQLNQNQQQGPFGQQGSGFGNQQQGGTGSQQPVTPGGQQFPPDQNH